MSDRFVALRERITAVRDALATELSEEDFRQVSDLLEANELGVALEWLVDTLVETKHEPPPPIAESIRGLARDMGIEASIEARMKA